MLCEKIHLALWSYILDFEFPVYYLHQGGYVFAWVCLWICEFASLIVNKITQKLMDGFWWNFQDMSEKVKGRNDSILGVIWIIWIFWIHGNVTFKDRLFQKLWMDFDEIFRICAPLAEVCALRMPLFKLFRTTNPHLNGNMRKLQI